MINGNDIKYNQDRANKNPKFIYGKNSIKDTSSNKFTLPDINKRSDITIQEAETAADQSSIVMSNYKKEPDNSDAFMPRSFTRNLRMYRSKGAKLQISPHTRTGDSAESSRGRRLYCQTSKAGLLSMGLSIAKNFKDNQTTRHNQTDFIDEVSPDGDNKHVKRQVEQQQKLIENRIRRLNQERDKTLKIIEQTIETTYRFKSMQRDRMQRKDKVINFKQELQYKTEMQKSKNAMRRDDQQRQIQIEKKKIHDENYQKKQEIKRLVESKLEEVKRRQELEIEELKEDVKKKKAQRQYERYNKAIEVERQRKAEADKQRQKVMKEINQGKQKIDKLAEIEMQLIKDLSSTQKMKKDVQSTLERLRKRNNSLATAFGGTSRLNDGLDEESQLILEQFNLEYQTMKRNVFEKTKNNHEKTMTMTITGEQSRVTMEHSRVMINEESANPSL